MRVSTIGATAIVSLVIWQSASGQGVTFKSRVDVVTVDVVVTDSGNRPISGLTKDRFEIVERGRAQTIDDFKFVSVPVTTRDLAQTQMQVNEDVATNVPVASDSRLFVVVVDDLHLIESEIIPIKRVVSDFISRVSLHDEVAIVFVGNSSLSRNFTRDTKQLVDTVEHLRGALGFGLGADEPAKEALGYARSSVWTLGNVVKALAGSQHSRRAILYVGGFTALNPLAPVQSAEFTDAQTVQRELVDVYAQAKASDVPIYTIDPRSLVSPDSAVRGEIKTEGQRQRIKRRISVQQNWLSEIATNTGGRAFINASNLTQAVTDMLAENGSYYLLTYSPSPSVSDGKYQSIDVRVLGEGLRVRARQGYVAGMPPDANPDTKTLLTSAMKSGLNVASLELKASVTPVSTAGNGVMSAVTVEVTYPDLFAASAEIDDHLRASILEVDSEGKVRASTEFAFALRGKAPADGRFRFLLNGTLELPVGKGTVRVGIASQALARAGMVQLPIDVRTPGQGKLDITSVAIGSRGKEEPAVINSVSIEKLLPFQPVLTRVFSSTEVLRVFATVTWGSATAGQLRLRIFQQGQPTPAVDRVVDVRPVESKVAVGAVEQSLADLKPGEYVLELQGLRDGQTASRRLLFTVAESKRTP